MDRLQFLHEYWLSKSIYFAITIGVLVLGLVVGALTVGDLSAAQRAYLLGYMQTYMQGVHQGKLGAPGLWQVFWANMDQLLWIVIACILIIGLPIALGLLLLHGFAIGFSLGFLLQELGGKGILLAMVTWAPMGLLTLLAFIMAGAAALEVVSALWKQRRYFQPRYLAEAGVTLLTSLLFAGALLLFAAGFETYLAPFILRGMASYF